LKKGEKKTPSRDVPKRKRGKRRRNLVLFIKFLFSRNKVKKRKKKRRKGHRPVCRNLGGGGGGVPNPFSSLCFSIRRKGKEGKGKGKPQGAGQRGKDGRRVAFIRTEMYWSEKEGGGGKKKKKCRREGERKGRDWRWKHASNCVSRRKGKGKERRKKKKKKKNTKALGRGEKRGELSFPFLS